MVRETPVTPVPGVPAAVGIVLFGVAAFVGLILSAVAEFGPGAVACALAFALAVFLLKGLLTVEPNQGAVITLFGRYVGTVREPGLGWVNPFTSRRFVSVRVRNNETNKLKVNDARSNPIEIGAIVVWKVVDTAEAVFEVDNYEHYVNIQAEAAVRSLAQAYPYDANHEGETTLAGHTAEISAALQKAVEDRLAKAGVQVIEARISHLAYAPEIAAAMLQRQQAGAVVAARRTIVDGAVGMVDHALELLAAKGIVSLDDERRAAMVSNLLVVLCSDRAATPVVNTGTLYS